MFKAIKFFNNSDGSIVGPNTNIAYIPGNLYRTFLPLEMCKNGFHFPSNLAGIEKWGMFYYSRRLTSWIVEINGVIIEDTLDHKFAGQDIKLIEEVPITIRSFDKRNCIRDLKRTLRANHPDLIYYDKHFNDNLIFKAHYVEKNYHLINEYMIKENICQ
jgi:hypothetical protein